MVRQRCDVQQSLRPSAWKHRQGEFFQVNRDALLFRKQINGKDKRQNRIDQNGEDGCCRAPCYRNKPASFDIHPRGDLLDQQIRINGVFRQNDIVFRRKPGKLHPPLTNFFNIGGNIADKFISRFPQARNHHKHNGKYDSKHENGA